MNLILFSKNFSAIFIIREKIRDNGLCSSLICLSIYRYETKIEVFFFKKNTIQI